MRRNRVVCSHHCGPGGQPRLFPPGFGFSLWVVYALWIGVDAVLYPLCRWYAQLERRRLDWWLSYL
jgi:hypothetical protein